MRVSWWEWDERVVIIILFLDIGIMINKKIKDNPAFVLYGILY